ncbi:MULTISPECIES: tetratricopeptide repeat protein [unclassified Legionella]|uniref:tetratricopeptide repeat protein n=1 Tax=unclassified Legionella TaxID=2622702 RepID=UPI0010544A5C|nr:MULTISPECIES: SEL1-like repeat protein [unclassified Legionella]MDI9819099.1 SEL1-like repeat protein [Legionella sp. PL877]
MKSFVPWFYLVAATGSQAVYAINGLDAYRQGNYPLAAQALINQTNKDPIADYYLGRMRLYGFGELKNNTLALRHFERAAEKGVLPAQQLLARYYLIEAGDPEKALHWFKKTAAAGDVRAQMYCAAAYLFGFGTKKNPDLARRYYIDAAKSGDPIAQYTLGEYFLGSRDSRNKKLGLIWLNKAAEQGNPKAQLTLSELYASGTLVGRDNSKSQELLEQLAAKKYPPAMLKLGEMAIKQNNLEAAKDWFTKAAAENDPQAALALAELYLQPDTAIHNPKTAFMWMLHAAQSGSGKAQERLTQMYREGKGVAVDTKLADQWQQKAKETASRVQPDPGVEVARWLTNDKADHFDIDGYRLGGIYSAWQNPQALKENNYNTAPQMEKVTRTELYKPKFVMTKPEEIAITDYFDVIAPTLSGAQASSWTFPRYPLESQIEALRKNESLVLRHTPRISMAEEGIPYPDEAGPQPFNYLEEMAKGWQHQANYQAILSQLYGRAILGEADAQFELGQLYHYGVVVAKNPQQAITYYQLAATQQDVRAEYNLGILYLEGQTDPVNYQQGINWLIDAAFKGNAYAQYALANIYEKGFKDPNGKMIVYPNIEQAMAMYYLASANHYGPAEYRLAEYFARHQKGDLSVAAKRNRTKLIKRLYQGAVNNGVVEASLPLAFYQAMDEDPEKQLHAFEVAKKEAQAGNGNAALLLGIMFERGIAVPANPVESLYWYQQAAMSPVSAFILGTYYSQGIGVNQDLEKGKSLLQQAADEGFSYANLNLAVLKHEVGENFFPELNKARQAGNSTAGLLMADYFLSQADDPDKMRQAREIYQDFAERGDKEGQLKLAYLYDKGLGGQVDSELAAKWYGLAADQGQPIAQYLLGQLYQLGKIGKKPDYDEARKWYAASESNYPKSAVALGFIYDTVDDDYQKAHKNYQLAAEKNNKVGQFNLALIYEDGKGVPVDYAKAKVLYSKAAESGHKKSMTQLADLYFHGLAGDKRDEQQALYWYKKAAELGDGDALYKLGLLSETGVATKLDFVNAVNYYQQAASKGNEKAKLALARMHQYGLGVSKDNQKAAELYKELAANNNTYAQYQLGVIYFDGINGEHKPDEGKRLLQQASANGSQQARKILQWLDAQQQERVSFIEPVVINQTPVTAGQPADLMYFDALNEWNRGDENLSRMILDRIMNQFPQYVPAKRAYEQLKQPVISFLGNANSHEM